MAYEFRLPDIGEGLTEAEVVRWLVEVGSEVSLDQPLVEVETDKAVVEIPSPRKGVVLHHGAPVGSVLEVGAVLAVIGEAGETWGECGAHTPAEEPLVTELDEIGPACRRADRGQHLRGGGSAGRDGCVGVGAAPGAAAGSEAGSRIGGRSGRSRRQRAGGKGDPRRRRLSLPARRRPQGTVATSGSG